MKYFLLLFFFLFFKNGEPVKVIKATSQEYVVGRKEAGKGINYTIAIVANKSSRNLVFNNVLVNEEALKVKLKNTQNEFVKEFAKGDTLIIHASKAILVQEKKAAIGDKKQEIFLTYKFRKKNGKVEVNPSRLKPLHYN